MNIKKLIGVFLGQAADVTMLKSPVSEFQALYPGFVPLLVAGGLLAPPTLMATTASAISGPPPSGCRSPPPIPLQASRLRLTTDLPSPPLSQEHMVTLGCPFRSIVVVSLDLWTGGCLAWSASARICFVDYICRRPFWLKLISFTLLLPLVRLVYISASLLV